MTLKDLFTVSATFFLVANVLFAGSADGSDRDDTKRASVSPSSKIAPGLGGMEDDQVVRVIVQFSRKMSSEELREARLRIEKMVLGWGGEHVSDLDIIKSSTYEIPARAVRILAADPGVRHISVDSVVDGTLGQAPPTAGGNNARQ